MIRTIIITCETRPISEHRPPSSDTITVCRQEPSTSASPLPGAPLDHSLGPPVL